MSLGPRSGDIDKVYWNTGHPMTVGDGAREDRLAVPFAVPYPAGVVPHVLVSLNGMDAAGSSIRLGKLLKIVSSSHLY